MQLQEDLETISVLHSMDVWLSQTMTWLYTQVKALPSNVNSYIVADKTSHLDQFPIDNLISADRDLYIWRRLGQLSWQIAQRRGKYLLEKQAGIAKAQVLHSHFGDRGWHNLEFAKRNDLKHVVTFYGYDASRLPIVEPAWRSRYAALFSSADAFLCEGPYLANTLKELGCPEEKIRVHNLGVPVKSIPFKVRVLLGGEPIRILIAGSFVQKKGIPIAIRALAKIRDDIDFKVTVIGDSNGQDRSNLEKLKIQRAVAETGLSDCVTFLGYQTHRELLRQAYEHHVFLSPSIHAEDGDSEGGAPVSLIEMAATGIQIVSTKHCDIPHVILDNSTGLLSDEGNVEQLEYNLRMIARNTCTWRSMSQLGRKRIELHFDSNRQGRALAEIYRSVAQT